MEDLPDRKFPDAVHAVAKAVGGMIPIAGSAISVLLETVFAPPLERRRERWFRLLAEAVEALQSNVAGLTPEALASNDAFITMAAQATQIALRTHQEEKLSALRSAVYHAGLPGSPDEDLQAIFLRQIEELTPTHLRMLQFFDGPSAWMSDKGISNPGWSMGGVELVVEHAIPELRGRKELYQQVARDLQVRGLLHQGQFFGITMTGSGLLEARTTGLAKQFLSFISASAT